MRQRNLPLAVFVCLWVFHPDSQFALAGFAAGNTSIEPYRNPVLSVEYVAPSKNKIEIDAVSYEEERHDPLGKRVLRRNKTPGPVPPLWFIALFIACGVSVTACLGYALYKFIDALSPK